MELDTKQLLMKAAVELFATNGFGGTSVKEICEKAGVNVSLVSYYFEGKEGLFKACLEQLGKQGIDMADRLLTEVQSKEEFKLRLSLFVEEVVRAHVEQPHLTKLIHRECMNLANETLRDVFDKTFHRVFESLRVYVEKAQAAGFVRADLDPLVVTGILFGSITHLNQSDDIRKHYYGVTVFDPVYRKKTTDQLVSTIVNGVLN